MYVVLQAQVIDDGLL